MATPLLRRHGIFMADIKDIKKILSPSKQPDKQFYLDLLDTDKQRAYEEEHLKAVLQIGRASCRERV